MHRTQLWNTPSPTPSPAELRKRTFPGLLLWSEISKDTQRRSFTDWFGGKWRPVFMEIWNLEVRKKKKSAHLHSIHIEPEPTLALLYESVWSTLSPLGTAVEMEWTRFISATWEKCKVISGMVLSGWWSLAELICKHSLQKDMSDCSLVNTAMLKKKKAGGDTVLVTLKSGSFFLSGLFLQRWTHNLRNKCYLFNPVLIRKGKFSTQDFSPPMRKMWCPSFTSLPLCFCFLVGFWWNLSEIHSQPQCWTQSRPAGPDLHALEPRETTDRCLESTMWSNVKQLAIVSGYHLSTRNMDKSFPNHAYWRGHAPASTPVIRISESSWLGHSF